MNNDSETALLHKAHAVFNNSTIGLHARVLARLREARKRAVAETERRRSFWRVHSWALPTGAVAILFVAAVGGLIWLSPASQPAVPFLTGNDNADMAIVLSNDNLDMYADMDFYRWLGARQPQPAPQGATAGNNNG